MSRVCWFSWHQSSTAESIAIASTFSKPLAKLPSLCCKCPKAELRSRFITPLWNMGLPCFYKAAQISFIWVLWVQWLTIAGTAQIQNKWFGCSSDNDETLIRDGMNGTELLATSFTTEQWQIANSGMFRPWLLKGHKQGIKQSSTKGPIVAHLLEIACIKSVWGCNNHVNWLAIVLEPWMNKLIKIACWQHSCLECLEASHELGMLLGNSNLQPEQQHQHSTWLTWPCCPQTIVSEKPSKICIL